MSDVPVQPGIGEAPAAEFFGGRVRIGRGARGSLQACLLYAVCWIVLTWPLSKSFTTAYWMDSGDGLVSIWNLWHIAQQPFNLVHTDFIYWPEGAPLLLHSFHPVKGWISSLLPLSAIPRFNATIVLTFLASGLTMYWLALWLTRVHWASLIAGFAFMCCGFHWAHLEGHMNLISTEGIPLFVLAWLRLTTHGNWRHALLVAGALLYVTLSDYYFALCCALFALATLPWRRPPLRSLPALGLAVLATSGAIAIAALWSYRTGDVPIAHPDGARLDPVALFVPGAHWRFASLTSSLWSRFPGNIHESSVHVGIALWIAICWKARRGMWWAVLGLFALLAMGPAPSILGHAMQLPLPYAFLVKWCPPLALGGVPVRFSIMVAMAAAVLGAYAFRDLKWTSLSLVGLLVLELWPAPITTQRLEMPTWVEALHGRPDGGALFDPTTQPNVAMYYQTRHGHPISGGFVARTPARIVEVHTELTARYEAGDFGALTGAGFRYLLTSAFWLPDLEPVAIHGSRYLYDLQPAAFGGGQPPAEREVGRKDGAAAPPVERPR